VTEAFEEQESRRQNGGAAAWGMIALLFWLAGIAVCVLSGCVSGNKAELSAVKIEKQSTAQEVDQYVNTAGRVADWLLRRGD
jgi:hypothetical protein